MPLSLVLYGVIYEKQPSSQASRIAKELKSQEDISTIISHIEDELNNPKQKVSEILDFEYPDEDNLREFLASVLKDLRRTE